jgi:hypothetical protein
MEQLQEERSDSETTSRTITSSRGCHYQKEMWPV